MAVSEIPLTADNQQFSIVLAGTTYDEQSNTIISGIPLVTGADLLAQYAYLGLGFKLAVFCDDATQAYPTKTNLGTRSHLLVSTE